MTAEGAALAWQRSGVMCLVTPGASRVLTGAPAPDLRESALVVLGLAAIRAGIDLVQIREPDLPAQSLLRVVTRLVAASRGSATRIVVNDRLDVALVAGADGVHLGGRSLPPRRVREMAPEGFLVGRSVHGVEEAREIAGQGVVDYLIAGTVFPSASKPATAACLGAAGLAAIVGAVALPVLGIGGITLERLAEVARTGAAGVAAISLFEAAADLGAVVQRARQAFDTARGIP